MKLFILLIVITSAYPGISSAQGLRYFDAGYQAKKRGDLDTAIAQYTLAINAGDLSQEDRALAFSNRGSVYTSKGQDDRAIEDFTAAIRFDATDPDFFDSRGVSYKSKGQYDRAIEDYNAAIRIDPNHIHALNNRGNAYVAKGQHDRAIEDYNTSIRLKPNFAEAFYNRGRAYYGKQQYDRAIEDYNAALRFGSPDTETFGERGNAYFSSGRYDRADDFTEAIRINPRDALVYGNRALARFYLQRDGEAESDLRKAYEIDPAMRKTFEPLVEKIKAARAPKR